jgi:hypothetical protein
MRKKENAESQIVATFFTIAICGAVPYSLNTPKKFK